MAPSWCEFTCPQLNLRLFRKSAILTSLWVRRDLKESPPKDIVPSLAVMVQTSKLWPQDLDLSWDCTWATCVQNTQRSACELGMHAAEGTSAATESSYARVYDVGILVTTKCRPHLHDLKNLQFRLLSVGFPGRHKEKAPKSLLSSRGDTGWASNLETTLQANSSSQNIFRSHERLRFPGPLPFFSAKTTGPGEKGAPRNHPEISSQKLADLECRFPCMTPMEGTEHRFGPF